MYWFQRTGRRPRGRRGLKPATETWAVARVSRRPRGRRGLKRHYATVTRVRLGRRPRGRRGLKQPYPYLLPLQLLSPPSRAAWIETASTWWRSPQRQVAALAGGVD